MTAVPGPAAPESASKPNPSPSAAPQSVPTAPVPGPVLPLKVEQRAVLYSWVAPQRFFKKLERKSFFIVLGSVIALSLLLVLLKQYYLMAALFALVFLVYTMGTFPPPKVTNVLTNMGVETSGETYPWAVLTSFYYSLRDGQLFLNIETVARKTAKLIMLVSEAQKAETYRILSEKLLYKDMRKQARLDEYINGVWVDMLQNTNGTTLQK